MDVFCFAAGLPFYEKMERSFGFQFWVWAQITFSVRDFVTAMEITHKDPTHAKYKVGGVIPASALLFICTLRLS